MRPMRCFPIQKKDRNMTDFRMSFLKEEHIILRLTGRYLILIRKVIQDIAIGSSVGLIISALRELYEQPYCCCSFLYR